MNQVEKLPVIQEDGWLAPYAQDVLDRLNRYKKAKQEIESAAGTLLDFARAHYYYGINFDTNRNGWIYREWAPAAHQLHLIGDFNNWDRNAHPLTKNSNGDWEIF
ncbi:MAG TPA: 1,4-alpha-glucan-branching enzyme, partial [Segetibacter sp.]